MQQLVGSVFCRRKGDLRQTEGGSDQTGVFEAKPGESLTGGDLPMATSILQRKGASTSDHYWRSLSLHLSLSLGQSGGRVAIDFPPLARE
jgi:hypothetical protein